LKKKSHFFLFFILIWTIILLAAGTYGLYKLSDFLSVYECCELAPVKAEFESSFCEDNLQSDALDSFIATLDNNVLSADGYREIIRSQLRGAMQLEKLTGESSSSKAVYRIVVEGTAVGKVVFEKDIPMPYGLYAWRQTGESYSFGYLLKSSSIEVPSDYTVSVNGYVLGGDYIVSRRGIEGYENTSRYTAGSSRELVTYSFTSMGEQSFAVRDEFGTAVAIESLTTDRFMQNCTAEQIQAVETLSRSFIDLYTNYSTGISYYYYYNQIKAICVPGSDIMTRLTNSLEGYEYSMRRPAEITALDIYRVSAINENEFLCDIRYTVDAKAGGEIITTDYDVRLIINASGGSYLVSVLTSN